MKITYLEKDDEKPEVTGVKSQLRWGTPLLKEKLREAFGESPRENITELIVDQYGLTAVFASSDATMP